MHTTNRTDAEEITGAILSVMTGMKTQMSRLGHDVAPALVLFRVAEREPVRVSDLAVCCGLDASTVSRHVKTLEDQGYVARSGDPQDRRASRVELTDGGRSYMAEHLALRSRLVTDATADWPPADRQEFLRLTQRLAASLSATPTPTPTPTSTENS
ncbi:MAG: MarR family protein [Frankiales bacterium]|nr:MarR family protein [Frankiales bacterium]